MALKLNHNTFVKCTLCFSLLVNVDLLVNVEVSIIESKVLFYEDEFMHVHLCHACSKK